MRLLGRERDAFAVTLSADRSNASRNLSIPVSKHLLSVARADTRRGGELGLVVRAVEAPVFFAHVVGRPLARCICPCCLDVA